MFTQARSKSNHIRYRQYLNSSATAPCFLFAACCLCTVSLLTFHICNSSQLPVNTPTAASAASQQHSTQIPRAFSMAATAAAPQATAGLRAVLKAVPGMQLSEGAGVQIRRTVGTPRLKNLDPFLMLDELKLPLNQATAGFPDHPHRGFETCSIMLEGQMEHHDSSGNKGVIGPGGVQWMTAGRGLVHSEMPVGVDDGRLWGFQLWISLPSKHKMTKPRYQDYQAGDIPVVEDAANGNRVRVMAGTHAGTTGPITMVNPGMLMDVIIKPGGSVKIDVPQDWSSFAYVYDGVGKISGEPVSLQHAIVLGPGDHITAAAAAAATDSPQGSSQEQSESADADAFSSSAADHGLKFLLMAGAPINEPIVQHGPFVMNTREEIMQAFMDYQAGKLQDPNDDVWAAN